VRAMEKENKKLRDVGRKKRNEEVRELVAFVRKRDKRLAAYRKILEERRAEQEIRAAENRKQQIRERLKQMEGYQEASYENKEEREHHLREIESALDAQFGGSSESNSDEADEEDDDEPLYCIACEKAFKTPKAMENHERSKKHKDIVAELKKHMQAEDAALLDSDTEDIAAPDATPTTTGGKKSKRQKRNQRKKDEEEEPEDESVKESSVDELSAQTADVRLTDQSSIPNGNDNAGDGSLVESINNTKPKPVAVAAEQKSGKCDTCGEVFDSRSQLFKHLDDSGHAKLKNMPAVYSSSKPKKSKGKKK